MKRRNKLICALTAAISLLTPTDSALQAATNTPARSAIMADSLQRVLLNAKTANDSLALLSISTTFRVAAIAMKQAEKLWKSRSGLEIRRWGWTA